MPLELQPAQPEPVARVLEALVDPPRSGVDPWWAAGIAEALRLDLGASVKLHALEAPVADGRAGDRRVLTVGADKRRLRGDGGPAAEDARGGARVVEP